jgi:hypothetical protein
MVIDADSNYAVFDDLGRTLYFQPMVPSPETWAALLGDWEGSRRRFELLLQDLLAVQRADGAPRVERDGASIDVEPLRAWEHERLRFVRSDVSDLVLPPAGVVRCCNMLLYFDRAFRSETLARLATMLEPDGLLLCGTDWIHTTEARYFTYRKRHGALADGEFNFSLDNVAPLSIASWYTLHDDDVELALLTDMVGILRADRRFVSGFMERSDALRAEMNLVPRAGDGYYVSDLPKTLPAELWMQASRLADTLGQEFAPAAVAVLERQGLQARVNSVGHVAVTVPVV